MKIESLELFLSVAAHGSISHAARQSYISQQGVSSVIKKLERDFGVKLFDRNAGGLKLTEGGYLIMQEAIKVVDAYHRMMMSATVQSTLQTPNSPQVQSPLQMQTADLLITPFVSSALADLFADYEFAAANMRLRIIERNLFKIVDDYAAQSEMALKDASSDRMPLRIIAVMGNMDKTIKKLGDGFRPIIVSELMAACPIDSPLAKRDFVTREELCEYPLVYYSESFLNRIVRRLFKGMQPNIRQSTSNFAILNRAMKNEGAVTFTDTFSVYLNRKNFVMVNIPIKDSVSFFIGFLGKVEPGSPEDVFAQSLILYLRTVCASYMERYDCTAAGTCLKPSGGMR